MKYLKLLIVPLVLYMVGLMLGPMLGSMLVSETKEDTSLQRDVKIGDLVFQIDLAEIRDNDLPQKVKLVSQVKLPTIGGDGFKELVAGREVKLINRKGKKLIIESQDGLAKGDVDLDQTNIYEVIGRAKLAKNQQSKGGGNLPSVVKNPDPAEKKDPPAPEPEPPAPEPEKKPEMPVVAEKKPVDPAPEEDPEPAAPAQLTDEQIVEVMKKSIAAGAVKEFTLKQVKAWKAAEEEEIDGETYQTGLAAYEAQTIFGKQTVQAKALIKGGKVTKWVYAKTGMEIR